MPTIVVSHGYRRRATLRWTMNLRQVNLNLLVALHALLTQRNVTRAADEVGLTQSAMSGELRRLRALFADDLLVRVGREYQLTPLAEELVEPMAHIIATVEQTLSRRVTFDPASDARSFSIAMSDYAMVVLLQPVLQRLGREAPRITLHIHPLQPDSVNTMLRPGGMDLVIAPLREVNNVCCVSLFSDRYVCAVRADHPQVKDQLTLELFERLPRLEWGMGSVLVSSTAERHYRRLGGWVQVTTETFALAPFLLRNTDLLAVLQERIATAFRDKANINVLDPPVALPDLTEAMYWSPVVETDPGNRWLRTVFQAVAHGL
jgi:LysR family transcriptional regulator, nod-box dependent transcriptional activator